MLISGGDLFEGQVFYVRSMQISRGDLYEGHDSSKHNLLPYKYKIYARIYEKLYKFSLKPKKRRRRLKKKISIYHAVKTLRGTEV